MPMDTQALNQQRQDLSGHDSVWLFGYGSLLFKADFPYLQRQPAWINHWVRRFWQGSHDHRGTPEAPGRVLTLVEAPGERCFGMAYQVEPEVFGHLDHREKNGYLRFQTEFELPNRPNVNGLVYIATAENAAWLGPAPQQQLANHIARATGPSGPNAEYLLRLAQALDEYQVYDPHVHELASLVREQRE